jgi:hypothetical protein
MATLFPTSLDALHNPHSALAVNAEGGHAKQHVDANDAIEALQTKVGINGSAVTTSLSYKIATLEAFNNNLGNTLDDYVPVGDVGQADGVASLDSSGKIPIAQLGNLINGAPGALDTLNELAAALGNDSNYATTITNALSLKAPLASPTFTGTVAGITKTMVGLGSVDNTTDAAKPISTATQTALDLKLASATAATTYETITNVALKAPIASPTFTGTVAGITSTMVGLGNVDNTSDANKPVSTATQTALDLKATLASPALTGIPTAPTAISSTNTTQIATTAYVKSVVSDLTNGAGAAYDTLKELQDLMIADDTASAALTTLVGTKAPIASPTFTGTVNLSSATVTGVISVIQQNGSALTKRPVLNFLGGALVEDDLVNNRINVTITGGIPELVDGGNFDSVSPYDGGAPDATIFENTFDAGEIAA